VGIVSDKNKIPVAIIIGSFIIGVFIYFSSIYRVNYNQSMPDIPELKSNAVFSSSESATIPISTPSVTIAVDYTLENIKEVLAEKLDLSDDDIEVDILQNTGLFAKGEYINLQNDKKGEYLALKNSKGWSIAYIGQLPPKCADIQKFKFPRLFLPECIDELGNVKRR
jgi:hypothetical protein